jgi:hypothetical protein
MATEEGRASDPREIQLGPGRWTVNFDGQASYDWGFQGITLFRSHRIQMGPDQSDTDLPRCLLHEILHALGFTWEIAAWQQHTHDDNGKYTDKIDLMATALLQFMRDNPEVIRWMQEKR